MGQRQEQILAYLYLGLNHFAVKTFNSPLLFSSSYASFLSVPRYECLYEAKRNERIPAADQNSSSLEHRHQSKNFSRLALMLFGEDIAKDPSPIFSSFRTWWREERQLYVHIMKSPCSPITEERNEPLINGLRAQIINIPRPPIRRPTKSMSILNS